MGQEKGALQQVTELVSQPRKNPEERVARSNTDPVTRFYDILDSADELATTSAEPDWSEEEDRIKRLLIDVLPAIPVAELASEFAFELVARARGDWLKSAIEGLETRNGSLSANLRRLRALEPYQTGKEAVIQRVLEIRRVNEAAGVFMTRIETIRDHLHEIRRVAEEMPRKGRWLNKPPTEDEEWVRMLDDLVYRSGCWPGRPGRPRKTAVTT